MWQYEERGGNYVKQNKPHTKDKYCMAPLTWGIRVKFIGTKDRMAVIKSGGRGKQGSAGQRYNVSVAKNEEVLGICPA